MPWRCEPIPDAWNGLDRIGIGIVRGEFAELADASVDRVVANRESAPTADHEVVLRNYRAPSLSKHHEDLHHSSLEGLANAVAFNLAPRRSNAQRSQLEVRLACQIDAVHPH